MRKLKRSVPYFPWLLVTVLGAGAAWLTVSAARPVQAASPLAQEQKSPSIQIMRPSLPGSPDLRTPDRSLQVDENVNGLVLTIETPNPVVEDIQSEGRSCQVLRVDGFGEAAEGGEPRLPLKGLMIGIPPAAQPQVEVLESGSILLEGRYTLCPAGKPFIDLGPQGEVEYSGERLEQDQGIYGLDAFSPASLAEITDLGYVRSQRVALLRASPFQYNPATGEVRYYPHLRISVAWDGVGALTGSGNEPASTPGQSPTIVEEGSFEATLKSTLVNYETARAWRVNPPVTPQAPSNALAAAPAYKISVQKDGLYQINSADLRAAGVPVSTIDPRTFRLTNRGVEVPLFNPGEADGVFNMKEYFLFYGQAAATRYTDTNVYWLTWGGKNGLRMSAVPGMPGGAPVPAYFTATQHIEENHRYVASYPSGPDMDRWYWTYIMAQTPQTYTYTFELNNLYARTPVSATVRGLFRGYDASPQHHTQVYLNGKLVEDAWWAPSVEYAFEVQVRQADLREGQNTLVVKAPLGSGISYDYFLVNWFEVDYDHTFTAENNRLEFTATTNGTWEYQVGDFTYRGIEIYDITIPQAPRRVARPVVEPAGSGYQVRFKQTIDQPRRYLVQVLGTGPRPLSITQDIPSNLRLATNAADYLLIAYDGFYDQSLPLVTFRQRQRLRVQAVKLQDVYDEFSYGLVDPQAIHDFLAYAYANWVRPAPLYVLLVGDGNYDFKNYLGTGEVSYVPPYLADVDPWLGETANENYYVSVSGADILPDMHLGRLPVKTPAETTALVNKIIAYEQGSVAGDWNKNVLFVADDADSAGNFPALSDAIAGGYLPSPYTAQKLYYKIHKTTPSQMRAAIIQGFNQGALLVNYIGHAGRQWWAFEHFFSYTDVGSLTNSDRLPFVTPMTCLDGYFIDPSAAGQDRSSLAESLVRPAGKGAIASWSPTGLGVAVGHDYLNRGLYLALFTDQVDRIGAAATQAKLYLYSQTTAHRDLIQTYMLLGDPATRLRSAEPASTPQNWMYSVYIPMAVK